MAKKQLVKDQDKYIVRLPDGMRERIKEKADRAGMSMNEAIVWCLEQFFPAPATFEDRVNELAEKIAALKHGSDLEGQIDEITAAIDKTLHDIASDKLIVTAGFAEKVANKVQEWDLAEMERENYRPFDDDYYEHAGYGSGSEEPPYSGDGDPFDVAPNTDEDKD